MKETAQRPLQKTTPNRNAELSSTGAKDASTNTPALNAVKGQEGFKKQTIREFSMKLYLLGMSEVTPIDSHQHENCYSAST